MSETTLKLYFVKTVNVDFDFGLSWGDYYQFVICCESKEIARNTHPNGEYKWFERDGYHEKTNGWIHSKDINKLGVVFLGTADPAILKGVICDSSSDG